MLINPTGTNYDKHVLLSFFSLFNRLLINGQSFIKKNERCSNMYLTIRNDVMSKLSNLPLETVTKISAAPCILGRLLKG